MWSTVDNAHTMQRAITAMALSTHNHSSPTSHITRGHARRLHHPNTLVAPTNTGTQYIRFNINSITAGVETPSNESETKLTRHNNYKHLHPIMTRLQVELPDQFPTIAFTTHIHMSNSNRCHHTHDANNTPSQRTNVKQH